MLNISFLTRGKFIIKFRYVKQKEFDASNNTARQYNCLQTQKKIIMISFSINISSHRFHGSS